MTAPIKLGYWAVRGVAQPIRLLLEYTGVAWEDKLYSCGPAPEFNQSSWVEVKESLGLDFPSLPYLIDGNVKITQTLSIMRYIAGKFGLLGSSDGEESIVDMVAAEWANLNAAFTELCYSPEFVDKRDVYVKQVLPVKLERFSDFLDNYPYFAGQNITFVDFLMYEVLSQHKFLDPDCLAFYENLEDFVDRIENLERIDAYIKCPRFIKYPLNNKMASFGG